MWRRKCDLRRAELADFERREWFGEKKRVKMVEVLKY
jgi:hypothetical protein